MAHRLQPVTIMLLVLLACLLLAGCGRGWAPVEDRSSARRDYQMTADGHYRVRRGDTLHAIAFNFGLDWRDIADWNGIAAPYTIYPDQQLRLSAPPGRSVAATAPAKSSTQPPPEVRTVPERSASSRSYESPPATRAPSQSSADPDRWLWPAEGRILSSFKANDPARNGIDIAGREGQPVIATADGRVVYSGNGLIGYGELIIIKHSDRLLSAYGHNRSRLVSEGQTVRAGERIAEMGRNDRNQAMLHFEIRLDGTPRDPMKYLPGR